MRKQAFASQIAVFPLKPHVYCIKVRGRQDCFMVQWPSLPTSPPPESWLGDHRYPQSFYPKDFKQKLLFQKRPLILVPQSYAWSYFMAEGGHLFIYQLPLPMLKQILCSNRLPMMHFRFSLRDKQLQGWVGSACSFSPDITSSPFLPRGSGRENRWPTLCFGDTASMRQLILIAGKNAPMHSLALLDDYKHKRRMMYLSCSKKSVASKLLWTIT